MPVSFDFLTVFSVRRRTSLVRWLSTTLALNLILTTLFIRYSSLPDDDSSRSAAHLAPGEVSSLRPRRSIATGHKYFDRYVTLCPERLRGDHRTGNHLFLLAAAVYVAERTNRTVAMPTCGWPLDRTFNFQRTTDDVVIDRYDDDNPPCPCRTVRPPSERPYNGDDWHIDSESGLAELRRSRHRSLALCGLYQTHRYADAVGARLRRLLRFRPEVRREAQRFRQLTRPPGWPEKSFVRVGLHIRRGDFLQTIWRAGTARRGAHGNVLAVADEAYIVRAIDYFIAKHRKLQFVVATDDWHWTHEVFRAKFSKPQWIPMMTTDGATSSASDSVRRFPYAVSSYEVNRTADGQRSEPGEVSVAFADDETRASSMAAATDLAVLADCDAVAMSTGSFSWWAAWLANSTAVYYDRVPSLARKVVDGVLAEFNKTQYFPSRWTPL
jgi:galactoside 2-L-fucosyltransferase 1/2